MLCVCRSHWEGYFPYTNALWLTYLATKTSIKAKLKKLSFRGWKEEFKPFLSHAKAQRTGKDVFLNVFSPEAVEKLRPLAKKKYHKT